MGAAAGVMIAAHFTGVKSFLFSVKGKPGVGSYYLHGFWDMPVSVWEFLVVVSIVAQVPDVAMAQLLKDNRLALHVDVVKEKMGAAIQSITEFDQCLWMLLATVCGGGLLERPSAEGCNRMPQSIRILPIPSFRHRMRFAMVVVEGRHRSKFERLGIAGGT